MKLFVIGLVFGLVTRYIITDTKFGKRFIDRLECKFSKCSKTSKISIVDGYVVFTYPNGNEYNVVKAGEHYGHLSNLCECELKQKLGK